jgi:large subunit ribosomal protein L13
MRTFILRKEDITRKWYVIDAENQILGRLASRIAVILRGKHKVTFSPHLNLGDNVIITNAEKIMVTGEKYEKKIYSRFTGYPSGLKFTQYKQMLKEHPDRIVRHAVQGMLPKNKLGDKILRRLHIYTGPNHPHKAQMPEKLELK